MGRSLSAVGLFEDVGFGSKACLRRSVFSGAVLTLWWARGLKDRGGVVRLTERFVGLRSSAR